MNFAPRKTKTIAKTMQDNFVTNRTICQVWIPRQIFEEKQEKIENILWQAPFQLTNDGKFYTVEQEWVDIGGENERAALVEKEIPFAWRAGPGETYDASLHVYNAGEDVYEIPINVKGKIYLEAIVRDGMMTPSLDAIIEANNFMSAFKLFVKAFGEVGDYFDQLIERPLESSCTSSLSSPSPSLD